MVIVIIIVVVMVVPIRVLRSVEVLLVLVDHVPNVVLAEEPVTVTFTLALRSFTVLRERKERKKWSFIG